MEKLFYVDMSRRCTLWDNMWNSRTFEQELQACDMESASRELFLNYLPKEGKIVDAGCGFGKWVMYLHRRGYDIRGIDNNELAVSKLKEFDPLIRVELGDILNMNCADGSFDAYISMGVIEHFEEGPQTALREAYRVLKSGGLVFVSVPTMNVLRTVLPRPVRRAINLSFTVPSVAAAILRRLWHPRKTPGGADGSVQKGRYRHFLEYRYSRSELEGLLRQAGFEIVKTVPHDFYGSRDHGVGLVVDFPFMGARDGVNFRLNPAGRLIARVLNGISLWIACSSVLCVGRSLGKPSVK